MHQHLYSELVVLERAALARGPRTRDGLSGGLGAGEGLGALAALMYGGIALVSATVVGGVAGYMMHSWKVGAAFAVGTVAAEGALLWGASRYRMEQVDALYGERGARWARLPGIPASGLCPPGTVGVRALDGSMHCGTPAEVA